MKLQEKIQILSVLLGSGLLVSSCFNGAQAQSSVNLKKGQLQQAGWHKSALQVQIIDDSPIVNDLRRPAAQDRGFEIPIGAPGGGNRIPEGGIPLGSGPTSVRMSPNALPTAGFGSNIPARGILPVNGLQQAKMGGLGNKFNTPAPKSASTGVSARPLLGKPSQAARAVPASGPASYGNSYGPSGASVGGGGGSSSSTSVRATLLGRGK